MKAYYIIVILLFISPIHAAVYECVQGGQVIYTNKKTTNCKAVALQQIGSYTSSNKVYKQSAPTESKTAKMGTVTSSSASPSKQVKVATETQQKRDQGRVQVLKNELDNERKALVEAEKRLAESRIIQVGQNPQARQQKIQELEGVVLDRQENIRALQQEIVRM